MSLRPRVSHQGIHHGGTENTERHFASLRLMARCSAQHRCKCLFLKRLRVLCVSVVNSSGRNAG
jgi:hypothetical protein